MPLSTPKVAHLLARTTKCANTSMVQSYNHLIVHCITRKSVRLQASNARILGNQDLIAIRQVCDWQYSITLNVGNNQCLLFRQTQTYKRTDAHIVIEAETRVQVSHIGRHALCIIYNFYLVHMGFYNLNQVVC